jgi:hypothetical protein
MKDENQMVRFEDAVGRYFEAVPVTERLAITDILILSDEDREMYLGFWRDASAQRYGFRIEVVPHDTDLLIRGLLQARAECGGFEDVVLFSTSAPGVIFLAKRKEMPSDGLN